ncbi:MULTISPECIES: oligoendopeptidase F [unclassified Streptococcus]|uniref:oligoendopeptidase F n=1 Tax=unclassified Streptococcus TaxID=2608887 RepID=UPI001071AC42|nr:MULTISPECIES: oligoendopeptidase F [unclassified Streptococcus]MBF0787468.1 oligoendopeptidase F [Streptococcus sp. 19428wC2_LYSM12]MCQ9212028.1 oligoendopeptidase F [Streptococcus sp. B01]MCQ9213357.1 oligoendopeptidase F [Streptococcus sp. O1]TFV05552.1 oligoendopeptidase F [Streptococcus sp. LYSM12]
MIKQRNEIDEKYQWDLTTIFPTDEAWEAELAALQADVEATAGLAGHLLDSAKNLLEISERQLTLMRRMETVYVYASMKNDQDTREGKYQEFQAKALGLYSALSQAFAFYKSEFLVVTEEQLAAFMEEEPALKQYSHQFEKLLAEKEHVLSQEVEEVLAATSEIFDAPSETFAVLDNASIRFPEITDEEGNLVPLSHGSYISFMESSNRELRKEAYEALYDTYHQFQHTYAKTLQSNVKVNNLKARLRKYGSARHAALAENFIPESVYDTLIEAVNKHLPLLHRYINLRKKLLGIDDLKMYDMYTPLSDVDYKLTYGDALEKAADTLTIFGDEYSIQVKEAFENRWIDVHENDGKRSGAYSGGAYDTNAFMLLNWQDTLDNLYTLIHETGHSLHSMFTRKNQPYVYGHYSIFLAEIASTTNENLLTEKLLSEVEDDKTRFAILNHYLDGFRGTVFRQTQFAEFEQAIYQSDQDGEVLTADFLNHLYAEINEKYYGLSAEENPHIQFEWARIPHFYYNFYVYQYATGFAAASALSHRIVHGSPEDKEHYLAYLKAGSSDYPLNVIKKAGVDMTKEDYLNDAFKVFEARLTELESLVEKGVHL